MEIEVNVLWHTDESSEAEKLGIDYYIEDLETRAVTFYRIDAISPCKSYPPYEFTNIHSGGEKWIATVSYNEMKQKIKQYE